MSDKQRLLVCGDICGKFKSVFDRVESLNKKSGPFDLFLVTGRFYGCNNHELTPYKKGERTVSVPTYVLGPSNDDDEDLYPENEGEEILPNVTYLGKRGVYTTSSGLKIAYLSGLQSKDDRSSKICYTSNDCISVRDASYRGQPDYRGVDILITNEWPLNVQNLDEKNVDLGNVSGSNLISWLAMHVKPRYHFVASQKVYYERSPYRNHSTKHDTREIATRFIGVAPVANKEKERWMYACVLQPINKMRMMDLLQGTTDETQCPYDFQLLDQKTPGAAKSMGNGQYFYDMNSLEMEFGGRKRKHKDDQQKERKKPEFDTEKCWFCLLSPTVERHLIICVGEYCYLALAKGPLTPFHCLILPVAHHQSITQVPQEVQDEVKKFKVALHKFLLTMGDVPVFFERNYKTSHLQVQCVPVPKSLKTHLAEEFEGQGTASGIELSTLSPEEDFCDIMAPGMPYFHVELPDGYQLYTRAKQNFPLQLGRDILSSPSILDCEEKSDWRTCQLSKEEEINYVKDFREKFEPFDFTNED